MAVEKRKFFEDLKLEALLAEESCQTQEKMAESLGVIRKVISKRLKVMGIILNPGNWISLRVKAERS